MLSRSWPYTHTRAVRWSIYGKRGSRQGKEVEFKSEEKVTRSESRKPDQESERDFAYAASQIGDSRAAVILGEAVVRL